MPVTVLQLSNPDETGEKDVLGLWQAPQTGGEGISFASADEDVLIFQADLPADISHSLHILEQQARRVSQAQTGLTGTARQLDAFILSNTLKGREASYDIVTSTAPSTEAERELARWLLAATGETSFALDTGWLKGWETTQQRALTFLGQVQQSLTYQAWVESRQSDMIIGRTAVNWHGDFKTLWGLEAGRAEIASHTRCLTIALNTRAVWMRISMIVAQSAIKLALLASTNPLLALPAVLRYIQQALEQYQKLSAINQTS